MLAAISSIEFSTENDLLTITPMIVAKQATKNAATVACTCTSDILPKTMTNTSRFEDIFPKFACVDSREARHISKFPFSPNSAGTKINNSRIELKTFQC